MNIEKYLVLIRGEDKTEEIFNYKNNKNIVELHYKNSENIYPCSRRDFQFYKEPIEIDLEKYKIISNQGLIYNIAKALKFENYYRLFFEDGNSIVKSSHEIELAENTSSKNLSTNIFKYFKDISEIVSIKTEEGVALLKNEYKKINFIESNTALYRYLNPNIPVNSSNKNTDNIIYPFGANESQFKAVKKAMQNQISIIEGPPGTGKTQTILNIIANIVKNGQTVAVVSNNNAATDNVYEKLKKYGLDYLCAPLGKKENKEEFIKQQRGEYPQFKDALQNKDIIENEVNKLNQDIDKIFTLQNNIAKLKEELNRIQVEHTYFNQYDGKNIRNDVKIRNINIISSDIIMKLKVECEDLQVRNKEIDLWFKLKSWLLYGIGKKDFYKNSLDDLIKYYNKIYFIIKEIEINNSIRDNNRKLRMLGDNKKVDLLTANSIKLLHEYLREKYKANIKRKVFSIQDLYKNSRLFNEEYPIILSTTYSIKNSLEFNYKFDYIIMDEASQVDLITGTLTLSSAKNAIIVGDLKQLPNVISSNDKEKIEQVVKNYNIAMSYDYLENSFLSSVSKTLENAPKTLLKEHYRCHPKIIGFCNKKFYNDELIIMTEDKGEEDVLKAYVTVSGNHARGHFNQRQIDVIKEEVLPELNSKIDKDNIGIISPYKMQKNMLETTINEDIQIDTVHKFQGREQDGIIITTVDNEIGDFVDDSKMLNVAVSRAKKYLRLVVSNNKKNEGTNIYDLVKYIQYNNFEVVESKVKSIYDLLYKENREKRLAYLKNKKRISDYDSENLTYALIEEIIKKNNYDNLDIAVHIPLKEILKDMESLDDEELKYASNIWTHIDFVIFNKMDKKVVIAIEVDGYYCHKEGTKQNQRDKIKDKILEKYDIPLMRLSTISDEEEKRLEREINSYING